MAAFDAMRRNMWAFQQTSRVVDLTIVIGKQQYECHRIVLGSIPGYFEDLLAQGFRESHPNSERIHIRVPDPALVFHDILKYLYTGDLSFITDKNALPVYFLSAYFQLPELQKRAEDRFKEISREQCLAALNFLDRIPAPIIPDSFVDCLASNFFRLSDIPSFVSIQQTVLLKVLRWPSLVITSDFELARFLLRVHEKNPFPQDERIDLGWLVQWGLIEEAEWRELPNWELFLTPARRTDSIHKASALKRGGWTPVARVEYLLRQARGDIRKAGFGRYNPPLARQFEERDNVFDEPGKIKLQDKPIDKNAKEFQLTARDGGAIFIKSINITIAEIPGPPSLSVRAEPVNGTDILEDRFGPKQRRGMLHYERELKQRVLARFVTFQFTVDRVGTFKILSAQASGFVVEPPAPKR
jgi:hypothetical protein